MDNKFIEFEKQSKEIIFNCFKLTLSLINKHFNEIFLKPDYLEYYFKTIGLTELYDTNDSLEENLIYANDSIFESLQEDMQNLIEDILLDKLPEKFKEL